MDKIIKDKINMLLSKQEPDQIIALWNEKMIILTSPLINDRGIILNKNKQELKKFFNFTSD